MPARWARSRWRKPTGIRTGSPGPTRLTPRIWTGRSGLAPRPNQPFDSLKFGRWRYFWDFGGGIFTDLMTHWIDVIQWVMKSPAPNLVRAYGGTHAVTWQECPDTV